jgi:aminoglycoside phosphotransferase (APT) family kinase protein
VSEPLGPELLARATRAADARWPGACVIELEPLPGGISSLTFTATLNLPRDEGRRVVVKVAPPGLPPVRNRDVLRQASVMRALHGIAGVRVPEVLLQDAGAPPFFVMEFVDGEAYEPRWDESPSPPAPAIVAGRARAAARMLAVVQRLAPRAVGLGDEPALALAQELERWAKLFATAGDDLRGAESRLHAALAARVPEPVAPRILHGDYRLGNMLFVAEEPGAIIDWEIWSVGDPRTDLAWLLHFSEPVIRRAGQRDAANRAAAEAMPDRQPLLAEYVAVTGTDPGELSWFAAYCHYKLASTMAVLAKRNRRLAKPDPGLETAAASLAPAIARGLELIEAGLPR